MSLAGTAGSKIASSSNSISEQIQALIAQKNLNALYQLIKGCQHRALASKIYEQLFDKALPRCWIAFLQNAHLNAILGPKELISIAHKANLAICDDNQDEMHKKFFHYVLVAIARNSAWCRMLSYRFFLDYVANSKPLLEHVIFDMEFMTHLDYVHMKMLFDLIVSSREQEIVLEYLDELLEGNSPLYAWALECVQYMFIHSPSLNIKLQKLGYDTTISKLKSAFLQNKFFALEILKDPSLYAFFGLDPQRAHQHPLLDSADYQEIIAHLGRVEPMLAYSYTLQSAASVSQEGDASVLCLSEAMVIMSFNEKGNDVNVTGGPKLPPKPSVLTKLKHTKF